MKVVVYLNKTENDGHKSHVELTIQSKEVLHETEIFAMMEIHFPAHCKFTALVDYKINPDGYELELTEYAYAYSIYRNRNFSY